MWINTAERLTHKNRRGLTHSLNFQEINELDNKSFVLEVHCTRFFKGKVSTLFYLCLIWKIKTRKFITLIY